MTEEHTAQRVQVDSSLREDLAQLKAAWRQAESRKTILILLSTAVLLCFQHYFGTLRHSRAFLQPYLGDQAAQLWSGILWCLLVTLLYALLPMLFIKWVFRERLRDYGLNLQGLQQHWKPYAVMFALFFPVVFFAAQTASFQQMYPFIKPVAASVGAFVLWQLAYGTQFFAVEFLFRGYLLFGLEKKLGAYALPLATIPYCMVHFAKPMGESLGAIVAGLVLGYLALKNRSIYGGALLHWSVALSMDALAIYFSRS